MELDRAARPFVERDLGRTLQLPDEPRNRLRCPGFRPFPEGTGLFHCRSATTGRSRASSPHACWVSQLVAHQRPTVDQFILIQLPSHARKLHPQRGVRDRIAAGDTILTDTTLANALIHKEQDVRSADENGVVNQYPAIFDRVVLTRGCRRIRQSS